MPMLLVDRRNFSRLLHENFLMHSSSPYGPDAFEFVIPGFLIILLPSSEVDINPCFFFSLLEKTCANFEEHWKLLI